MTQKDRTHNLLLPILKNLRLFIVVVLTAMIIASGISLVMPHTYRASIELFPPTETSTPSLSNLVQGLTLGGFGIGAEIPEIMVMTAILKSRNLLNVVINEFELDEEWGTEAWEEAIDAMRSNIETTVTDEGTLNIAIYDKTMWFPDDAEISRIRNRVVSIADFIISELDRINLQRKVDDARNYRINIENRYNQAVRDLAIAEEEYRAFSEEYGVLELPTQVQKQIETLAAMHLNLVQEQIKYEVLQGSFAETDVKVVNQKKVLDLIEGEYNLILEGNESMSIFLEYENIPDIGIRQLRAQRELELQSEIFKFLTQQLEEARLREKRETPTLQILDHPQVPDKRTSPKRTFLVLSVGLLTAILLYVYVVFRPGLGELLSQVEEESDNQ